MSRTETLSGVRWMSQLGYDPHAAMTMLTRLGSQHYSGMEKYLASHPEPAKREQRVAQLISDENLTQVARQHGGPRLWDGARAQNTSLGEAADELGAGDAGAGDLSRRAGDVLEPLRLYQAGQVPVVLASVESLALWGKATFRMDGAQATLQSDAGTLHLTLNDRQAVFNGQNISMTAPAVLLDGRLFAPVAVVAQGLGGSATLTPTGDAVVLRQGNHSATLTVAG